VQIIFAGKAHPSDNEGKEIINGLWNLQDCKMWHRVVFLENYDINIARYMVQGCDVWSIRPDVPTKPAVLPA
jgi:starch phosphorylase